MAKQGALTKHAKPYGILYQTKWKTFTLFFFLSLVTFCMIRLLLGAYLENCMQDMCKRLTPLFFSYVWSWYLHGSYLFVHLNEVVNLKKKKKWSKQFGVFAWVYWSAASSELDARMTGRISPCYPCSQTTLQHCSLVFLIMNLQGSQLSSLHLMQIKFLLSSALRMRHKWCTTELSRDILHYLCVLVFLH